MEMFPAWLSSNLQVLVLASISLLACQECLEHCHALEKEDSVLAVEHDTHKKPGWLKQTSPKSKVCHLRTLALLQNKAQPLKTALIITHEFLTISTSDAAQQC